MPCAPEPCDFCESRCAFRLVSFRFRPMVRDMLIFAVTTLEKIHAVPRSVWINVGIGVLIVIALVMVVRLIKQMSNAIVPCILVCVVLGVMGFNWLYSRTEPAFLTPIFDKIAPFFPSEDQSAKNARKLDKALGH